MNIHIDPFRIRLKKDKIGRNVVGSQDLLITAHNRLVKIGVPDIPVVYIEELLPICFPGMFGLTNEATDPDNGSFSFKRDQVCIGGFTEDAYNTLTQVSRGQLQDLSAIMQERAADLPVCE